jgi:hypothetical protein
MFPFLIKKKKSPFLGGAKAIIALQSAFVKKNVTELLKNV